MAKVDGADFVADNHTLVWDFSGCESLLTNVKFESDILTDSAKRVLVSETVGNLRTWFFGDEGGSPYRWYGEETRNSRIFAVDSLALESSDTTFINNEDINYRALGCYASEMEMAHEGHACTRLSQPGVLVNLEGDSVKGVVRQDFERIFAGKLSTAKISFPLDAVADTLAIYHNIYSRWFMTDNRAVPLAIMIASMIHTPEGALIDSVSTYYVRIPDVTGMVLAQQRGRDKGQPSDRANTYSDDAISTLSAEQVLTLLQSVEINIRDNELVITPPYNLGANPSWNADAFVITAGVADVLGNLYFSGISFSESITIPVGDLPHGQYIVVLNAPASDGTNVVHKEFVRIY